LYRITGFCAIFVTSAFGREEKKRILCRLYEQHCWFQGFLARNSGTAPRKSQKHESRMFSTLKVSNAEGYLLNSRNYERNSIGTSLKRFKIMTKKEVIFLLLSSQKSKNKNLNKIFQLLMS
jgi:hypothetical protein